MAVTGQTIITDALLEIGAIDGNVGPMLPPGVVPISLSKLSRIIDNFNAAKQAVYNVDFLTFTLIPSQQSVTIGPGGDWDTTARPVSILGANVILNTVNPQVRVPVNIRDDQWWLANTVRGITSTFPTDLYYSPAFPLGIANLWPVPTVNYGFELEVPIVLTDYALTTPFVMPPGYRDAITLTLAEDLCGPLGRQTPAQLPGKALLARNRCFSNNVTTPRLITQDAGMPPNRPSRETTFNYRSGLDTGY